MRRNQAYPNRTNTSNELDLHSLATLDLENFTPSGYEIYKAKNKTRDRKNVELQKIINAFNKMITFRELPADKSFARVISALRQLGKIEQGLELFILVDRKANLKFKEKIIGRDTLTAVLEIYRSQMKLTKDSKTLEDIVTKAEQLWKLCETNNYIDGYLLTDMMGIYSGNNQYEKATDLFSAHRDSADLQMYSQYILALSKMNNLELARQGLDSMKKCYENKRDITPQDEKAMYCVYDKLIIKYYDDLKEVSLALQVFDDAIKFHFYQNNQLQMNRDKVQLNFHLYANYKEKEGSLPLPVAKIAFLYFMQQVTQQEIHIPAEIVTGGHIENQSKLKNEFPEYLRNEYGVEIQWHNDPRILAFEIPYTEIRKIRFINDVLAYLDSQEEHFDSEHLPEELTEHYRGDLRRNNEGRVHKYFSDKPTIPKEFKEKAFTLAKDGMKYFETWQYGKAERLFKELTEHLPTHPWSYTQLGWVLHRTEHFDEAIVEYQKTIDLLLESTNSNQQKILSEAYRKTGWAYYWKHLRSDDRKNRSLDTSANLTNAFKYYQLALKIYPNNIEVYNNRGILFVRVRQYKDAIKQFKFVKDNNPQHDECCVHLGNCYKQLDDYEQAKNYYQQAITRSEVYNAGKSAAWAYYELGDLFSQQFKKDPSNEYFFDEARKMFEFSLKLQPKRDQANYGLGELYKLKGDMKTSDEYFTKARNTLPDKKTLSSFAKISKRIGGNASSSEVQNPEVLNKEEELKELPQPKSNLLKNAINQEDNLDKGTTDQRTFGYN